MTSESQKLKIYQSKVKVRFRDADPAGIMFFGNILGQSHDLFEDFIVSIGFNWNDWFCSKEWASPIRHTEVDFLAPFQPGKEYSCEVKVQKLSESSLYMQYEYRDEKEKLCSRVQMVHTFISPTTFQKIDIPQPIRKVLETYL